MNLIDLPMGRQTFDFDCGAKALQIVMAYYGVDIREDQLMHELKATDNGVPVKSMVAVAESKGFQVKAKCHTTLEEVRQYLEIKHPVIVLVQAWAERPMTLQDWRKNWDNGHYVIILGDFGDTIVFEDPASFRRTWMTEEEFLARWHDMEPETGNKLENFSMVLLGRDPVPLHKTLEHMD